MVRNRLPAQHSASLPLLHLSLSLSHSTKPIQALRFHNQGVEISRKSPIFLKPRNNLRRHTPLFCFLEILPSLVSAAALSSTATTPPPRTSKSVNFLLRCVPMAVTQLADCRQDDDCVHLRNGMGKKAGGKMPLVTDGLSLFTVDGVMGLVNRHPVLLFFAACVLFFMGVEYTLVMVPSASPPFDIGFVLTRPLNILLAQRPNLNSALAALNTVFVVMQTVYILWALLMEHRPRATISALYMFTCRGILGYCTQLPLPKEFLGSGMDFPVGNVSFFLFFSGHVAGGLIASLDMRRMGRDEIANVFDTLNLLQALRLLATRGHYTIDLAVGVGAGILFDFLAGKYEDGKARST